MGSRVLTLTVVTRVNMSSQVFYISSLLLALIGLAASQGVDQDDVDRQGYANSVYDNEAYNYGYYDQDVYDRQDSLGLDNLTLPVLATAFLAAFLASLIGSTLAGNLSHMLSLDFAAPAPLQVKALPAVPLVRSGEVRGLDDTLKTISDLFSKFEDS